MSVNEIRFVVLRTTFANAVASGVLSIREPKKVASQGLLLPVEVVPCICMPHLKSKFRLISVPIHSLVPKVCLF